MPRNYDDMTPEQEAHEKMAIREGIKKGTHAPEEMDLFHKHLDERDARVQAERKRGHMRNSDRGFHTKDMHEAAEAMRMKGEGSEDPVYPSSKKNR